MRAETMKKKVEYLVVEFGLSRLQMLQLIMTHTRVLDYSISRTYLPRVRFYEEYFQKSGPALGMVICKHPRLLWVSHLYYASIAGVVVVVVFVFVGQCIVTSPGTTLYSYFTSHCDYTAVQFPQTI